MKTLIQKWGIAMGIFILAVHFVAQFLGAQYLMLEHISKAMLLPILMMYLYVQPNVYNKPGKNLVMLGLFGSFLGDVFLISKTMFIPGMIAFMMTHICNILFFSKIYRPSQPRSTKFYIATFLLACFCVFIYFHLKEGMGKLIYPVLVYMALISTAALMAIHISNNKATTIIANSFWIPGMLFFLTTDSILAFNKFDWAIHSPISNIGLLFMLTYGLAQFFLIKGFQLYFTTASKQIG